MFLTLPAWCFAGYAGNPTTCPWSAKKWRNRARQTCARSLKSGWQRPCCESVIAAANASWRMLDATRWPAFAVPPAVMFVASLTLTTPILMATGKLLGFRLRKGLRFWRHHTHMHWLLGMWCASVMIVGMALFFWNSTSESIVYAYKGRELDLSTLALFDELDPVPACFLIKQYLLCLRRAHQWLSGNLIGENVLAHNL